MEDVPLFRRLELVALLPDTTRGDLEGLCADARRHRCLAVCVAGSRVELVASLLDESEVKVCALVGFPFGTSATDVKRIEVETAIDDGAQEIEMVLNLGWIKDGNDRAVLRELRDVREAVEERPLKALIEWALLTPDEIRRAAMLTVEAEAQFLVTATGCAARPSTPEDVRLLRDFAGPELGLKAVGGILTREQAEVLIASGANRVGVFAVEPFVEG